MSCTKIAVALLLVACILVVSQADSVNEQEKSSLTLEDVASDGIAESNNRVKRQFGILGSLLLGGGGYRNPYYNNGYNQGYYGMFVKKHNLVRI